MAGSEVDFNSSAPMPVPTVSVDSQTTGVKTFGYAGGLPSSNCCIVSPGPMACWGGGGNLAYHVSVFCRRHHAKQTGTICEPELVTSHLHSILGSRQR